VILGRSWPLLVPAALIVMQQVRAHAMRACVHA
jgi:hypothetical protein